MQTVAKNYKDEILFIHVDLAHGKQNNYYNKSFHKKNQYSKLILENLPMLRLLVVTEDVPAMYLYNITDGARYLLL